jgi:hypothetical protein
VSVMKLEAHSLRLPQAVERIGGRLGPNYALDKEWMEAADKRAAQARGPRGAARVSGCPPGDARPCGTPDAGTAGGRAGRGQAEHGQGAARGARAPARARAAPAS